MSPLREKAVAGGLCRHIPCTFPSGYLISNGSVFPETLHTSLPISLESPLHLLIRQHEGAANGVSRTCVALDWWQRQHVGVRALVLLSWNPVL